MESCDFKKKIGIQKINARLEIARGFYDKPHERHLAQTGGNFREDCVTSLEEMHISIFQDLKTMP